MRLQKLEINGFKSFASKIEIFFNSGITAIVGPNGSGKSNIADAVRWVLGEQSAKSLRGARMEDVIFSGTEQRRSLGYCEVAVTFDNSDGMLPTDYAEVTIQRRVYRSGESEYLMNKTPCRLRDIVELLRDTGIGKEGYSIIGQGRVDAILSEKSEDRRAVFEEAVGVAKYKSREEEAERKLKQTEENIVRMSDIIGELETQKEPLFEQSEKAREFLRMRDALRELELNAFLAQYDQAKARAAQNEASLTQLGAELEELRKEEVVLAKSYREREDALREKETALSALTQELNSIRASLSGSDAEQRVLKERRENSLREIERIGAEVSETQAQIHALETERDDGAFLDTLKASIGREQEKLAAAEADLASVSGAISEKEAILERQKQETMEALNRMSDTKSLSSRLEAMKESIENRAVQIAAEKDKLDKDRASLLGEREAAAAANQALENERARLDGLVLSSIKSRNELQASANGLSDKLRSIESEARACASRAQVLAEMKQNHEGYYQSVRLLLRDAEQDSLLKSGVVGVVAELIRVPKEYETALETALGASLQHLVTRTDVDAKRVIEHLRAKNYGRTTCLPLNSMQPRELNARERDSLSEPGVVGVASELIGYDRALAPVISNLLGRTVIVRDMDTGIRLSRQNRWAFRVATLKGDILNPGGSMSGGSAAKKEFSLLGRGRELTELEARVKALEAERNALDAKLSEIGGELNTLVSEAEGLSTQKHAADISLTREREKLDIIEKYIAENGAKAAAFDEEAEALGDNLRDIEERLREAALLHSGLERDNITGARDVGEVQEAISELKARRGAIFETITAQKISLAELNKEHGAYKGGLIKKEAERERLGALIARRRGERESAVNAEAALGAQIEALAKLIEMDGARENAQQTAQDALSAEVGELRSAADGIIERREGVNAAILDITERQHRVELQQNRLELERSALQKHIWEEYELTYEGALSHKREGIKLTGAQERIAQLRQQIRDLGDVHVGALEDYKNLTARLDSLLVQRDDLNKAGDDLKRLISELLATISVVFKEQFALINRNFAEVFSSLFGGGKAELKLADESDVLTSNIVINAQPPGKKLQLLSLLSGGERALTAIALLFAMLKLKPTPFCVLDEIESSLDEANVDTFARFLRDYADKTQFILITHRKGSMVVSDSLYGVAMEEKGVSRLISVQLVDQAV